MQIAEIIWLDDVVEKIQTKHDVSPEETEEVFFNGPRYRFIESGHTKGEDIYAALGRTDAGRYLIVFFIQKQDATSLILSARDMDKSERKRYAKK